jgi:putative hemolysin
VHKRLRTLLLPRELANKENFVVRAAVGELLTSRDIDQLGDSVAITQYLRLSTEMLAPQSGNDFRHARKRREEKIAPNIKTSDLQCQIDKLESYQVVDSGVYAVYCAPYHALGCLMGQIAIDRETTFRAVGEGTGRELDSDHFDPYYWHLWVWHKQNQEIVGAYRVGKADEILRDHGIDCLYSRSLYEFDGSFIGQIGQAIEVGRSFVALPYQRQPKALDLLWRGIGAFMVNNPDYHTLFGPVSISRQYSALARAFLADTMMSNFSVRPEWQRSVRPQSPLHVKGKLWTQEILSSLGNVTIINKLLGNLDHGKRIPILLRHYLALNGHFVSFTVNKGFNDSLDGLILVDLREAPDKYLNRYLGKDGRRSFLSRWSKESRAA